MNSKRTLKIIGGLAVALLFLYLFWPSKREMEIKNTAPQSSVPEDHSTASSGSGDQTVGKPNSQTSQYFKLVALANEGVEGKKKAIKQAYASPIEFWGKVVDQDGNPIEGAQIKFTINNTPDPYGNLPTEIVLSDANGLFSLTGKNGLGLSVWVSKEGYYSTSNQSSISLNYSLKGGVDQPFPTQDHPSVFVLKKKGQGAALIHKKLKVPIPKNGTSVEINLAQGKVVAAGQGDLKIESWVNDDVKDRIHPYPWKCQVTILGGGWQLKTEGLDFAAPADGYQAQDQVEMTVDNSHWSRDMVRQYFLHLNGDRYVRMRFWMINGGNNFVDLDYYLNPQSGDRNLEFDAAKEIKAK
ncbi:MAG: hypothetical protein B9S32_03050 [Verrucomicrobia bacterium Tous-C9LFEB]|nr:MAG: hypothetical protein B9S32_03050 [Verrucomicrobia bacterium Tous-C9LFEB]